MAKATDPRPIPNLEIYDFEGQFEEAFRAAFVYHNMVQPATQQDSAKLATPRIECQFVSGTQEQRSYLVPGTNEGNVTPTKPWAYQNVWLGSLKAAVVTNRLKDIGKAGHRNIRNLLRWLMQDHINEITARMKYLTVIQTLETGGQYEFNQTGEFDISSITFAVKFNIRPSAFPTPS